MHIHPFLRTTLKWSGFTLLGLLLLLILCFFLLQTGPGKKQLASALSRLSSHETMTVELSGFKGWIPFDFSLDTVRLSDAQGAFLDIRQARLSWSLVDLLQGCIRLEDIGAGSVHLQRLPVQPDQPAPEKEQSKPAFRLWPVRIDQLDFPAISLGEELLGQEAVFALHGDLDLRSLQRFKSRLQLERIDRPGLSTRLQADCTQPELKLDWRLQAPKNGLLQVLTKQPLPGDLDLQLQGSGPPETWSGRLDLSMGDRQVLNTQLQLGFTPPDIALTSQGRFQAADFLPPPYARLVEDPASLPFSLDLGYNQDTQRIHFKNLQLATHWGKLHLAGTADVARRTLKQQVRLQLTQLAGLQPLLSQAISGTADIEAAVQGPWDLPSADLKCSTREIRFGEFQAADTVVNLQIEPQQDAPASVHSIGIQGDLQSRELSHAGLDLSLPQAGLVLDAAWTLDNRLQLHRLKLQTPNETLQISGLVSGKGPFQTRVQADCAALDSLPLELALPFAAGLSLNSTISGNWRSQSLTSRLQARFRDLKALPPDILNLTGNSPRLSSHLTWNGTRLTSEHTRLQGVHLDLSVSGGLALNVPELNLNWTLSGPRLEHFGFAKARNAGGIIQARGSLQGPLDSLRSSLQAEISELRFPPLQASALTLKADAGKLLQGPQGHLAGRLTGSGENLDLETDFAFAGTILHLNGLKARAPQTDLQGDLRLDWQNSSLQSECTLQARDLSRLKAFLPDPALSGGLTLQLKAEGALDNPKLTTDFQARNLSVSGLSLEALNGNLQITDPKQQRLDLDIQATNLSTGGIRADQTAFTASGDHTGYQLTLETRGRALEPFQLHSAGSLRFTDQGQVLSLTQGKGGYGGIPLAWSVPLRLESSLSGLQVSCEHMSLGRGRAEFAANLGKERLQAHMQIANFDCSTLDLAGLPPLLGQAGLQLALSGTRQRPEIDLSLGLEGLRPMQEGLGDLPPLSAQLRATYQEQVLAAELQAESPGTVDLQFASRLPAELAMSPLTFQPRGELQGEAACTLNLNAVSPLLDLSGQQIKGRLHSELRLAGTLSEPEMTGKAVLEQGEYQNVATGTILKDIALECSFDQRTISLVSLSGFDGQDGRITASGTIDLLPGNALKARAEARLDKVRLVRLPFLDAQSSGDIAFKHRLGDSSGSELSGDLRIVPIELGIPEPQPETLEGLRIVRAGDQPRPGSSQPEAAAQPDFLSALNLNLHIAIPSRCFVRGQGLDSEWNGEFTVGNTAAAPKINGDIELIRGHVEFLTKRFELQSGTLTFVNEVPPKPLLDITATTRSGDLDIVLNVSGPATDPQFTLDSEPALPRDEILAHLLFNTELDDLNAFQAVKLALAVKTLASGGRGEGLMGTFRKSLGLDELAIQSDAASQEGTATVGMGKYLNEDIYFRVEQGLGQDSTEVSVRIALTPSIALETRAGSATQGLELFWEFRY